MDETVASPAVTRRRRLSRLGLPRLALPSPRLPKLRLWRRADPSEAPLIAGYRRPRPGAVTVGVLLLLLTVAAGYYGWFFAATAPRMMILFAIPPAIFTLFLIWALPEGAYAPTGVMTGFFWAFFAAFILWPNYLAIALPGLPWLTLIRFMNAPLVIAFLICISVSRAFRNQIADSLKESPFVWKSLLVYLAIVLSTVPLAGSGIGVSVNKVVVLLTTQIATFFISTYLFLKPRRLEAWLCLLLFMVAILCAIGLWENKLGYVPWAGHIPSFLKIEDDSVTRALAGSVRAAIGVHRVESVETNPLLFAELLGLATPFALHLAIHRYPVWIRVPSAMMLPVILYTIILTDSRLGFVSLLVAGALYLLLWALVRWREVRGSIFGPAVVLSYPAIFVALIASTLLIGRVRAKVWGNGAQAASNEGRKMQWRAAIPKLATHPFGHGYGTAGHALGFTNGAGVTTIDSYYINLFMDTGVLGFVAYLTFFLGASWYAARQVVQSPGSRELRLLMPLSVALVAFVIDKAVLSQDANHPLPFFYAGAIAALIYRSRQETRRIAAEA